MINKEHSIKKKAFLSQLTNLKNNYFLVFIGIALFSDSKASTYLQGYNKNTVLERRMGK